MFTTQAYKDAVEVHLKKQLRLEIIIEADVLAEREALLATNRLYGDQIRVLLGVVNAEQGTNFQLGLVVQGFRGTRDILKGTVIDPDVQEKTGIIVDHPFDPYFTNGPVLWVWIDNAARATGDSNIHSQDS